MNEQDFDPMLDCYLSWRAFIELCRERLETAGEYPQAGPWRKPQPDREDER